MKIKYILSAIAAVGILTGCQNDDLKSFTSTDGKIVGPFIVSVPFNSAKAGIATRASFGDGEQTINNMWIGVFDATDHRMIGSTVSEDGWTAKHENKEENKISLTDLYFNDGHPRIYIAAVANYDGIQGWAAESEAGASTNDLIELLKNVNSWEDYIGIAVDVASVEKVAKETDIALMSGMYTQSGHGNTTVDFMGVPTNDLANASRYPYVDLPFSDHNNLNDYYHYTPEDLKLNLTGAIHLRKLVSRVTVNVTAGANIEISNPSVEIYNLPTAAYVQERTMVTDPSRFNAEQWPYVTPAASDIFGYIDQSEDSQMTVYDIHSDDELDGTQKISAGQSFSFGYWHYENKHWSPNAEVKNYDDRDVMYDLNAERPVFKSLVPQDQYEKGNELNNGSTYFILTANVKDNTQGSEKEGLVHYLIHEGYCTTSDGSQVTDANGGAAVASKDFSTFRNTNYTYNITIQGLESIVVKATSDNGENPNPGAFGNISFAEEVFIKKNGETVSVNIPEGGTLEWAMVVDGNYRGEFEANGKLGDLLSGYQAASLDDFYNSVSLKSESGASLTLSKDLPAGKYELVFGQCPTGLSRTLYLSSPKSNSNSIFGSSVTQLSMYIQDATKLDSPIINDNISLKPLHDDTYNNNLNKFIKGLSDNKVYWTGIEEATYYKVSVKFVDKNGIETYNKSTQVNVTQGQTDVDFTVNYTDYLYDEISGGGILTVTVIACADTANGTLESAPVSISRSIWKPDWNLGMKEPNKWMETFNASTQGTNNRSITIDGLTVSEGGDGMAFVKGTSNGETVIYLDLKGSGNSSHKRCVYFTAYSKGKLSVTAQSGVITEERFIKVTAGGKDVASKGFKSKAEQVYDISSIDGPTEICIFSGGSGIQLYRVIFTPED